MTRFAKIAVAVLLVAMVGSSLYSVALRPYKVEGSAWEITASSSAEMLGEKITNGYCGNWYYGGRLLYNLKSSYRTVTFTIGPNDEMDVGDKTTISFYVDGSKVKDILVEGGGFPEEVEIELNYARQFRIDFPARGLAVITDIDFK